jgi:dUTP pyrophosphatase
MKTLDRYLLYASFMFVATTNVWALVFFALLYAWCNEIEQLKIVALQDNSRTPRRDQGNAGYDLWTVETDPEKLHLRSGEMKAFKTGIKMQIPDGYFGKIESRSSLSKHRITVKAGVIDSSYRGEVIVLLANEGARDYDVIPEIAIAQMVLLKHGTMPVNAVNRLDETKRGEGGFGSTNQ